MDIKIDSTLMREVVSSAIMTSISQEQRNILITNAVKHLLTPKESAGYGRQSQSPLEEAFNDAMRLNARRLAEELLQQDTGIQTQLRELITEAVLKLMTNNREATVDKIAAAIAEGISGKGY